MISKKDRQYNGRKTDNTMEERQTIQWKKDRQYNGRKTDNTMEGRQTIQWKEKNDKRTTMIYKTLYRKLKIEQHKLH